MQFMPASRLAARAGAGLTRAMIANIESGRRRDVGVTQLLAIAWALGITPIALILPIDDPDAPIIVDGSLRRASDLVKWIEGESLPGSFPPLVDHLQKVRSATASLERAQLRRQELLDRVFAESGSIKNADEEMVKLLSDYGDDIRVLDMTLLRLRGEKV